MGRKVFGNAEWAADNSVSCISLFFLVSFLPVGRAQRRRTTLSCWSGVSFIIATGLNLTIHLSDAFEFACKTSNEAKMAESITEKRKSIGRLADSCVLLSLKGGVKLITSLWTRASSPLSQQDVTHTHCFFGGKQSTGFIWWEFKKRGGLKFELCGFSSFSPERGEESCIWFNTREVFPLQPTSKSPLRLNWRRALSLICEKPRWDIQLRTA